MKKNKLYTLITGLSYVVFPALLLAASCDGGVICNPLGNITLQEFVGKILDVVIQIGFVVVVFFIIYSGFLFVTAQGNEEKLSTAKKAITWTLIGAAILLGAKVIETAVENTVAELKP